jgi:hypothetical protein
MRKSGLRALVVLVAGWATAAGGGILAPSKPSQMVLVTVGPAAGCPQGMENLTEQIFPDGTRGPFSIPPGQVLVVTEVEWSVVGAPPNVYAGAVILLASHTDGPLWSDEALTDGNGFVGKSSPVPSAIVKSGDTLCRYSSPGLGLGLMLRGFLTKDR